MMSYHLWTKENGSVTSMNFGKSINADYLFAEAPGAVIKFLTCTCVAFTQVFVTIMLSFLNGMHRKRIC